MSQSISQAALALSAPSVNRDACLCPIESLPRKFGKQLRKIKRQIRNPKERREMKKQREWLWYCSEQDAFYVDDGEWLSVAENDKEGKWIWKAWCDFRTGKFIKAVKIHLIGEV
jgi:hypothetical protein